MPSARGGPGGAVYGFVAELTGRPGAELPPLGEDWLDVLRQWLARQGLGLVSIAKPRDFSWPGHWIGVVDLRDGGPVGVLLFGTPSAVIASPAAPELVGLGVEELALRQGFVLAPFEPVGRPAPDEPRLRGEVSAIYVAAHKTGPTRSLAQARAVPGKGLEGDRYAAGAGTFTPASSRLRGYDLTLIESEVLAGLALEGGGTLAPAESRRNLVTAGIDLNELVGREFRVGEVRAFGQRLCEPCVHLQRLTRPGVVAALAHRGGLRADILSAGLIRVGDPVEAAP